ncbi:MAG: glycosyltransferase [Chromatiaceae bacterium]|nr:glycosyltransferase [Chromatiaceae bacterium]MCF8003396.1 glycosyltransferase [Chromatiaceae bacterium]
MTKSTQQTSKDINLGTVASITVTHNPDIGLLKAQLAAIAAECLKIVVDNASEPDILNRMEALIAYTPNTKMLRNADNLGLASATNLGVRAAREHAPQMRFALLLDQDSEPRPGSIQALVEGFNALKQRGEYVGGVGPLLLDVTTGLSHGFHQATPWRWRRIYSPIGSIQNVSCTNLNGSGTLVPIDLFLQLGGLDESLFIDHVDTEWSFRVLAAGYGLWGIPAAVFAHRMGQSSVRFWMLGWRIWPSRSPQRHYYLFRNAVLLIRRRYVPRVWKFWALVKMMLTAFVHGLFDSARREQWRQMWQGLLDGLRMSAMPPSGGQPWA